MEIEQKEKAVLLQRAVINNSASEIAKIYDELGFVEMSAPALGLACRFRGIEVVKLLVQKGASFDFPSTNKIEETYNCYIGKKYGNYRTNYSIYLLKAFGDDLNMFCLKGMKMEQTAQKEDGDTLPFLPDDARVEVLRYLLENREKIAFLPEEMLYYAIYYRDTVLVQELRAHCVKIPAARISTMTDGAKAMSAYWNEYMLLTQYLAEEDYLTVMQQLAEDFDGKPFHFTDFIFWITKERFYDVRIFEYFFSHFKKEKMNQKEVMRCLIDKGAAGAFPLVEREGWLAQPRKRDEMIAYATKKGQTEVLAWLLEYKNRTADLAAEQEKADKKLMRELNRRPSSLSPDSVAALKKIWTYHKREDGTLVVTNYKGTDTEVTVPEKIGKNTVTAIGNGAFSGHSTGYNGMTTVEQFKQHRAITAVILPDTIQSIGKAAFEWMPSLKNIHLPESVQELGKCAFWLCDGLEEMTIPEGVKEIGRNTFAKCGLLQKIVIPDSVERIGESAFEDCKGLRAVTIPEGVKEIGERAFKECIHLQEVTIPKAVERIGMYAFWNCKELRTVTISGTVEKIEDYAFSRCCHLKRVDIRGGVKEIGKYVFKDCSILTDVSIEEGVKVIDAYAFENCALLKRITIPETTEEIGKGAFESCSKLEEVCLRGEVKKIGTGAFSQCKNLKVVNVLQSIPNRILGELFVQCPELIVICPKGSKTEVYCKKKGIPCRDSD